MRRQRPLHNAKTGETNHPAGQSAHQQVYRRDPGGPTCQPGEGPPQSAPHPLAAWYHNLSSRSRLRAEALLFLSPALLIFGALVVTPVITAIWQSVTDATLTRPGSFVGLDNYRRLFTEDSFRDSVTFTVVFALSSAGVAYLLGLGIALLLSRARPARNLLRAVLVIPWLIPPVVAVTAWRNIAGAPFSVTNLFLGAVGLDPVYPLSTALGSQVIVILVRAWTLFPFAMLSLLSGIQAIDPGLFDAAEVDGANRLQVFRHVTIPGIRNVSIILLSLMFIWNAQHFATPWLMTSGGPNGATTSLPVLSYLDAFVRGAVGQGAAVAFLTLALVMVPVLAMMKRRREA